MRRRSGFLFFLSALFCLLFSLMARAQDQVVVDTSARTMWVGVTVPGETSGQRDSLIFARAMGTDQWQQLYQIGAPLLSLTHQSGEPAILLNNGEWMYVFQDGRSLGVDVPGNGRLVQLTSNGTDLCGAAWINGGVGALAASSRPTTQSTEAAQLAMVTYQHGQWNGLANVPDVPVSAKISLAGAEGNLLLAWASSNTVHVYQWSSAKGLQKLPDIETTFKIAIFKALNSAEQPAIWIAPATGAGSLAMFNGRWATPITLTASSNLTQAQVRDICMDSDGRFRMVYEANDQLFEQIYDHRGAAAGKPAQIDMQQQEENDNGPMRWLGIALITLLVFVFLTASRRQQMIARQSEQNARVMLAPLARRVGAGIIDVLPYMATVFFVLMPINPPITTYEQAVRAMNSPGIRYPIIIAMGVYLLHTTIGEIFFARSIGKLIFGLKVVNLRGGRPSVLAILARNICRLIDLPVFFLTILVSPLRQRVGDVAGGTMVVLAKPMAPDSPEPGAEEPSI